MISTSNSWRGRAAGVEQAQQLALLALAQVGAIVRMIEDQALDHVVQRPFARARRRRRRSGLELQRARCGSSIGRPIQYGRSAAASSARMPKRPSSSMPKRGSPLATLSTRAQRQRLERGDARRRRRRSCARELLELLR